jgi:hypothetical protein
VWTGRTAARTAEANRVAAADEAERDRREGALRGEQDRLHGNRTELMQRVSRAYADTVEVFLVCNAELRRMKETLSKDDVAFVEASAAHGRAYAAASMTVSARIDDLSVQVAVHSDPGKADTAMAGKATVDEVHRRILHVATSARAEDAGPDGVRRAALRIAEARTAHLHAAGNHFHRLNLLVAEVINPGIHPWLEKQLSTLDQGEGGADPT